jgi:hypothetical protein
MGNPTEAYWRATSAAAADSSLIGRSSESDMKGPPVLARNPGKPSHRRRLRTLAQGINLEAAVLRASGRELRIQTDRGDGGPCDQTAAENGRDGPRECRSGHDALQPESDLGYVIENRQNLGQAKGAASVSKSSSTTPTATRSLVAIRPRYGAGTPRVGARQG